MSTITIPIMKEKVIADESFTPLHTESFKNNLAWVIAQILSLFLFSSFFLENLELNSTEICFYIVISE